MCDCNINWQTVKVKNYWVLFPDIPALLTWLAVSCLCSSALWFSHVHVSPWKSSNVFKNIWTLSEIFEHLRKSSENLQKYRLYEGGNLTHTFDLRKVGRYTKLNCKVLNILWHHFYGLFVLHHNNQILPMNNMVKITVKSCIRDFLYHCSFFTWSSQMCVKCYPNLTV